MIDSHCHLADPKFDADRGKVVSRADVAGVTKIVVIADTIEESKKAIEVCGKHPHLVCTVGVHPHHASIWRGEDTAVLKALAKSSPFVRAIGEIGLDYHYDRSPRDVQQMVFREQLLLAKHLKLPSIVHCREAVEEVWSIVDDIQPDAMVIHCCTEKWSDVERFVERGHLLSFTGIATYPDADVVRDTITHCPLEQMMIETDAPFLAPVPHRGKRNEPAFVVEVAKCIAEIKGVSVEEVDAVTTETAEAFFAIGK